MSGGLPNLGKTRLTPGMTLAVVGDSTTSVGLRSYRHIGMALRIMGSPFRIISMQGLSGDTSATILAGDPQNSPPKPSFAQATVDYVTGRPADIVWLSAGMNDITSARTAAATYADWTTMAQICLSRNQTLIVSEPWSNTNINTAGEADVYNQFVQLIINLPQKYPNVILLTHGGLGLGTGTYNVISSTYSGDSIHLNAYGAYQYGKLYAAQLASYMPTLKPVSSFVTGGTANTGSGALMANPYQTGTGGSLTGGATGTVSDEWTVTRQAANNTGTVAASQVARTDGVPGNWLRVAVTGGVGQPAAFTSDIARASWNSGGLGGIAVGDYFEFFAEIRWPSANDGLFSLAAFPYCNPGASSLNDIGGVDSNTPSTDIPVSTNEVWWYRSSMVIDRQNASPSLMQVPASQTGFGFTLRLYARKTASAGITFDVGRCGFRKIT